MDWFRWHHGTVNDPKWRVIARKSGMNVRDVLAVFAVFLERASESEERGSIEGWDADDIGAGLDMDAEDVRSVHSAMQNKVLDGDFFSGWNKRQPKREDGSAERSKAWRERNRTQPNATEQSNNNETAEKHREEQSRLEEIDSEADASGAIDAEELHHSDLKAIVFGQGLDWLAQKSGKSKDKLRSALGRMCRDHGDAVVIEVLGAAQREGPIDPIAWLERAFQVRAMAVQHRPESSISAAFDRLDQKLAGVSR